MGTRMQALVKIKKKTCVQGEPMGMMYFLMYFINKGFDL